MSVATHMDITVDISNEEGMKANAVEVVKRVRPRWEQEGVQWSVAAKLGARAAWAPLSLLRRECCLQCFK